MKKDGVKSVFPLSGGVYVVVFEPRNPIEELMGGDVITVGAKNEEETIKKAVKEGTRLFLLGCRENGLL